jgi:Glycosyltransferase family 87
MKRIETEGLNQGLDAVGEVRSISLGKTIVAVSLLIAAANTTVSRIGHFLSQPRTFDWYYAWAAQYASGEPLWTPGVASGYVRPGVVRPPFCNYTPFFIKATVWLAAFQPRGAHLVWEYLLVAFLVAAIALFARAFDPPLGLTATAVAVSLALFSQSFRFLLRQGQNSTLLLLVLAACWLAVRRRRPAAAGLCLAAATLLKLYPGIVGGYFILRRKWSEAGWAAVFCGLGIIATGINDWIKFARFSPTFSTLAMEDFARPFYAKYAADEFEFSYRAAAWVSGKPLPSHTALAALSIIAGAAVLAIIIAATLYAKASDNAEQTLVFSLWVASGLVLSPLSWVHEFPLLDLAYLAGFVVAWRAFRTIRNPRWLLLVSGVVILAVCLAPELIRQMPPLRPPYLVPLLIIVAGTLLVLADSDSIPAFSRNPNWRLAGSSAGCDSPRPQR